MILAIDVGGTKVLTAAFNDSGEMLASKKIKTPKGYKEFIKAVGESVREIVTEAGEEPKSCCIALPAGLDRERGIAESFGNLDWKNVAVADDLAEYIKCPIYLENDAKAAAVAEADAVKGEFRKVLYVTVSTGIGLGMVVDGKLDHRISDAGGNAIILEHEGKLQSWEEFASGKAIVARTGKMASELTDTGEWYIVARNIALGLVDVITLTTPDCIVIGGGVGSHLPKFKDQLENELQIFSSKMIQGVPNIRQAQHPEEAVVYGCYLIAKNA